MSTPAPDAVKRLIDARDMTVLSDRGLGGQMSDTSDRVPSPADRNILLSGDHEEEQLRRPTEPIGSQSTELDRVNL